MIPDHLNLEIVTPTSVTEEHRVGYVRAPGLDGLFGVLPGHVPAMIALDIGEITVEIDGDRRFLATSGGYAEIHHDRVILLVETAEYAREIDIPRAEAALQRAEKRLAHAEQEGIDSTRAGEALRRAKNRLAVAQR